MTLTNMSGYDGPCSHYGHRKEITEKKEEVNKMEKIKRLQVFRGISEKEVNEFLLTNPDVHKITTFDDLQYYSRLNHVIYYWKPFYKCLACGAISEVNHCEACELKKTLCENCGVKRMKGATYCHECGGKLE